MISELVVADKVQSKLQVIQHKSTHKLQKTDIIDYGVVTQRQNHAQ